MMSERNNYKKGYLQIDISDKKNALPLTAGLQNLHLHKKRDALLYVPHNYNAATPTPLAVMLHGAGGDALHGMSLLQTLADSANIILLSPPSRDVTWDIITDNSFGADVIFISQAINIVQQQYNIDSNRIAIGGFSDGASYALCIGLLNGHLFTHVIAFSPGFAHAPQPQGKPNIFISHGIHDKVLPINPCSRTLVPKLQRQHYNITYHEFDGEHVLPPAIRDAAVQWFLQ